MEHGISYGLVYDYPIWMACLTIIIVNLGALEVGCRVGVRRRSVWKDAQRALPSCCSCCRKGSLLPTLLQSWAFIMRAGIPAAKSVNLVNETPGLNTPLLS